MQDIANYGKPSEAPAVDVSGKWKLNIDFQGQQLPVTLNLTQDDSNLTGSLDSMSTAAVFPLPCAETPTSRMLLEGEAVTSPPYAAATITHPAMNRCASRAFVKRVIFVSAPFTVPPVVLTCVLPAASRAKADR